MSNRLDEALLESLSWEHERVQIIKGWLDARGEAREKVIEVAWSGDRKPDPRTGNVPPVGNTVDVKTATWTNTIGAPVLTGR